MLSSILVFVAIIASFGLIALLFHGLNVLVKRSQQSSRRINKGETTTEEKQKQELLIENRWAQDAAVTLQNKRSR